MTKYLEEDYERLVDPLGIRRLREETDRLRGPLAAVERLRDVERLSKPLAELERLYDVDHLRGSFAEFERLHELTGAAKLAVQWREPLAALERVTGAFRVSELADKLYAPLAELDHMYGRSGLTSFAERIAMNEYAGVRDLVGATVSRFYESANSIGEIVARMNDVSSAKLAGEYAKVAGFQSESALMRLMESTGTLAEQLSRLMPEGQLRWHEDLTRSIVPSIHAHDILWPHDAMVLRMFAPPTHLGVASWFTEAADDPGHFELGALADERVGDGIEVAVDAKVCCGLCGGDLYERKTTLKWIGSKLHIRNEVLPICLPCSERDIAEPGYLRDALIAMIESRSTPPRPQLTIICGDGADPTPRGVLTLVPATDRSDEPDDDGADD